MASSQGPSTSTRPTARRRRRQEQKKEKFKRSGTAPDSPFGVFERPAAMLAASRRWHAQGVTVRLVPTMGALHARHLSLIEAARPENAIVVVSIFLNPIQFRPDQAFAPHPRHPA